MFENLAAKAPRKRFTVGIVDDVTHMSLPLTPEVNTMPQVGERHMPWVVGSGWLSH